MYAFAYEQVAVAAKLSGSKHAYFLWRWYDLLDKSSERKIKEFVGVSVKEEKFLLFWPVFERFKSDQKMIWIHQKCIFLSRISVFYLLTPIDREGDNFTYDEHKKHNFSKYTTFLSCKSMKKDIKILILLLLLNLTSSSLLNYG